MEPRLFHILSFQLNDGLIVVVDGQLDLGSEVFYHYLHDLIVTPPLRRLLLDLVVFLTRYNGAIYVTARSFLIFSTRFEAHIQVHRGQVTIHHGGQACIILDLGETLVNLYSTLHQNVGIIRVLFELRFTISLIIHILYTDVHNSKIVNHEENLLN